MGLCIRLYEDDEIRIGPDIMVKVMRNSRHNQVQLLVEAPSHLEIISPKKPRRQVAAAVIDSLRQDNLNGRTP